ncbi:MAG: MjaI family restriction endonuclease [Candidatus Pseudobacter hemicellulosilyticus]|uniref:MjaI family restriction endonuclease n=1 Tax=Candidatus Pseudobacter hemicellulosilyticus TaxID=3121375 RepID=A0AAJ5WYJ7_9BACT|nr:MAG: MjaI family restriction endonuclease [Pseudobacter sp.]
MEKEWLSGVDGSNLKFKRETLLNYGLNRWGLNKSHSVGTTSELIRSCAPIEYKEWENYYFQNAYQKKKAGGKITREYIYSLGQTLFVKLTEIVQNELLSITEEECIDYVYNLILNRTFEGYKTEIDTIYGQMEKAVGVKIEPAPDSWDRKYNVDFFIQVKDKYIGIQIKPVSSGHSINQYQWVEMHMVNHQKFESKYGGNVFFVYSIKAASGKKTIYNNEVIDQIKREIERLKEL